MRLASKIVAGAAAMASFASSQAQAADYLIYTFKFKGTETRLTNSVSGLGGLVPGTGNTVAEEGSIVYYLPTSFAGSTFSYADVSSSFMTPDRIIASTTSSLFTLNETLTGPYRAPTRNVSISACLAGGTSGASVAIDPSCSSVGFIDAMSLGTMGGDLRTITGTLTGLTITDGYGSVNLGLASYPLIPVAAAPAPEPAAWAMVIVGMGAIGYAMRRRKSATRVSYAA